MPAALFRFAVSVRNAAYDLGIARVKQLDVPVISVGNLSAGGTGKTPLCVWMVHELERHAFRPGLLSRGYGAEAGATNEEAKLFAAACPDVPHVEDPDRVRGGAKLVAQGVDAIVLDDGFQHRRLARDQDWVLVDATRPAGLPIDSKSGAFVEALLPRGLLSEPFRALARNDVIVITRSDEVAPDVLAELTLRLSLCAPGKPLVHARHRPSALIAPDGKQIALTLLADREVDLVSGIGNPEAFEHSVRALGATVRRHERFADHQRYTQDGVRELGRELGGGERWIVTTAKDAVKLAPLGLPVHTLAIEFELVSGASVVAALFESLPRGETQALAAPRGAALRVG